MTTYEEDVLEIREIKCPVCGSKDTVAIQRPMNIPNFPNHFMFSFQCNRCKFRHNDFFSIEPQEPRRYSYVAKGKDDWTTKIVRASSATIRIPKFGALIEPGPNSEGRITNIEGIILDIKEIVELLVKDAETLEQREEAKKILRSIEKTHEEFGEVELIIDDPMGNSFIIPYEKSKLKTRILTEEEIKELKTGFYTFDLSSGEKRESGSQKSDSSSSKPIEKGEKRK